MRQVRTHNAEEVMVLVAKGNEMRKTEGTAANPVSSRSHAVLQVMCEHKNKGKLRVSKLSLIDLAGSERASNTENRGVRLVEGAKINRSLLALGNCINALSKKGMFVNFRDSKLTRLLKDSLGGNTRTVMIAHVSPSATSFEETLNTLKYAHRARSIQTQVKVSWKPIKVRREDRGWGRGRGRFRVGVGVSFLVFRSGEGKGRGQQRGVGKNLYLKRYSPTTTPRIATKS